jgi:integrase
MTSRRRVSPARVRVGKVSLYFHHGTWWLYYRQHGQQIRRRVGADFNEAKQVAAQVNAQLAVGAPTQLAFRPIGVSQLRQQFLEHHELVLRSSMATVRRYRAATQHLEDFAARNAKPQPAHEVSPDAFAAYLRRIEVSPNGHQNSARRRLRDKGVQYILETCRALYSFAARRRHLPPYAGNPFAELPLDKLKIEDAKPIFVFDADSEAAFFRAADRWAFPLHFTLAKTGMRVGELTHLLIEDVDLGSGWLSIRNKIALGWRVKTGNERSIPLLPEVVAVLRQVIGSRQVGPVFLRRRFSVNVAPPLIGDRSRLEEVCLARKQSANTSLSRSAELSIARTIWRDAGAVKPDAVRTSFIGIMRVLGHPEVTCPKTWRHTFATLLQDANVDPLVRQLTLGHQPTRSSGLGMTAIYTHTRPQTQRRQIERALRRWPLSLAIARSFCDQNSSVPSIDALNQTHGGLS